MENILEQHEELLDKHDDDLCHIRKDLIDIKTRLGIKDLTNGQVKEYQEQLVKSLEDEKAERKEQDRVLREDLKSIDNKVWFIVTGIILLGLLDILKTMV